MFRNRIILTSLLLLGLLLSACVAPTTTAPAQDGAEISEEVLADTASALDSSVSGEAEIWHFWGSPDRRTALRRVIAICQQELPNIEITETFKPWGDIWTANVAAVAAGSGMPGIIVEDRPQLPQRARDQIATDLQPYIDRDNFDTSVFWDFTWNETLYEGDSYGIPFETDVRMLIWNKNAFAAAGLDPESPPETWEELEQYAEQLTVQNDDGSYEQIGFFPLWSAGPDFWARTNGWQQVQDGRPVYNTPEYIETVEWITDWIDRYGGWDQVQSFKASYGSPPNDIFMSGAVPMVVETAGYLAQLSFYRPRTADGEAIEWGASFIPYSTQKANWSGGFALSIPYGAEYPDAAWEVIKCMAGPAGQASWSRDTYAIPTSREVVDDPVLNADPDWATVMEVMEDSQGSTYVPEYPNFNQEINSRMDQVWSGDMTPEEALNEAQDAIDEVMAENASE